ncbi:hypothetical protein GH733_015210 [Mirounga leonina]|nr:hypothetical protein GH733_015210 [Mirounga leonina]
MKVISSCCSLLPMGPCTAPPVDSTPLWVAAAEVEPRSKAGKSSEKISTGRETLRLRSKGPATMEDMPSETKKKAIEKIDDLLELYMGIQDTDLATTILEAGKDKGNPDEFAVALDETLGDFAFPDEFVFDVWGVIGERAMLLSLLNFRGDTIRNQFPPVEMKERVVTFNILTYEMGLSKPALSPGSFPMIMCPDKYLNSLYLEMSGIDIPDI